MRPGGTGSSTRWTPSIPPTSGTPSGQGRIRACLASPAEFQVLWPATPYLVKGVKIYVDTNHNLSTWEEIDAVRLLDATSVSYRQTGNPASLAVEIGGLPASGQFGRLVTTGAAALDGTLDVRLVNGFSPTAGDAFEVLRFGSRQGQFATINGLELGNNNRLRANYSNTDVTLVSEVAGGIRVDPTLGLVTTEAGGTATFTVVLDGQPTADVTVNLSSSNTAEGTLSPASLTFTSLNWNDPQTVTVTGVDDFVDDGDVAYTIITAPAVSADPTYSGFDPSDVSVTNLDDDQAGFSISPTSGLVTTEAGATAAFTAALTSQPTANVAIALTSSNTAEGTVAHGQPDVHAAELEPAADRHRDRRR